MIIIKYTCNTKNIERYEPQYMTSGAVGFDLRADIPGEIVLMNGKSVIIPTGMYFSIPEGYEGQVRSRSGLAAKWDVQVTNSPGTIDQDYRGEIQVILHRENLHSSNQLFKINPGDRIAQMVICPVLKPDFEFVESLDETERNTDGFGSTGV